MDLEWPPSDCSDDEHFVKEEDIDRCVIEKMLTNRFHDPLASSESEDENAKTKMIDFDKIFKKREQPLKRKIFVACRRPSPPYPRVSNLTPKQHNQLLKIISAEYPNVLQDVFLGKPTDQDVKAYEAAKGIYLKEQIEYREWAKNLWISDHCVRALHPKPAVERVYEAEFKMKAQRMKGFPKHYNVAAHITLQNPVKNCDAVLKQDLISVTLADMPSVQIPHKIDKMLCLIKPYMVPEPCPKHPYQIVLPNEESISMLPVTEIHRELARFAVNNDTLHIASENALKCLTQWNRHWLLPLSVCDTIGPDGNIVNVMVLDSEFTVHKETAPMRTYKAYRHLLEFALIPWPERKKIWSIRASRAAQKHEEEKPSQTSPELSVSAEPVPQAIIEDLDESSDDEDNHLFIETEDDIEMPKLDLDAPKPVNLASCIEEFDSPEASCSELFPTDIDIGLYTCTCENTMYQTPPPRSFTKWSFMKEDTNEKLDIIIHCPHKAMSTFQERREDVQDQAAGSTSTASTSSIQEQIKPGELLMEPLPEYQIDLGASEQAPDSVRSVALSLALRENASVLNVRVDGPTGEVGTLDKLTSEEFAQRYPAVKRQVISTVHIVLSQLQELRPGHYVLQHEPSHGSNAMLMRPTSPSEEHTLALNFDVDQPNPVNKTHLAKLPPIMSTALLPYHKQRRVLPCAFTPYVNMLAKGVKRPPPKKKAPPQAIKFPKKKCRKINEHSTPSSEPASSLDHE